MNNSHSIPPWRKPAVDVPVQALREFLAQYGPNVAVLVTWVEATKEHQFVTIGSDIGFANAAVRLRNLIVEKIGADKFGPTTEDLRGDHPNVSLTLEQIDFALWLLGYIFAARELMDQAHRDYISKYHDQLLPVLGDAKDRLVKQPA